MQTMVGKLSQMIAEVRASADSLSSASEKQMQTLTQHEDPLSPVVVCSTLTEKGTETMLQALAA